MVEPLGQFHHYKDFQNILTCRLDNLWEINQYPNPQPKVFNSILDFILSQFLQISSQIFISVILSSLHNEFCEADHACLG